MTEEWMQDPEFRAEYERVAREEMPALDAKLKEARDAELKSKQ